MWSVRGPTWKTPDEGEEIDARTALTGAILPLPEDEPCVEVLEEDVSGEAGRAARVGDDVRPAADPEAVVGADADRLHSGAARRELLQIGAAAARELGQEHRLPPVLEDERDDVGRGVVERRWG